MIRLWIFIGIIVCAIFYYVQHRSQLEEVITNRIEEHNKVSVSVVDMPTKDKQWNFKHCTSNSDSSCGRLK